MTLKAFRIIRETIVTAVCTSELISLTLISARAHAHMPACDMEVKMLLVEVKIKKKGGSEQGGSQMPRETMGVHVYCGHRYTSDRRPRLLWS